MGRSERGPRRTGSAAAPARGSQVDTLRGFACLALVLFHTIGADRSSGLRLPDEHGLRLFSDLLAYVRMPLFAFLSGHVYALRPTHGESVAFLRGKARRLLVPMLLVGTIFALLQASVPGANFRSYDWHLLQVVPVAHYWFLQALFIVFVVVALLERVCWVHHPGGFLSVWLAAGAVFVTDPLPHYFGLSGATYLLPFVLLGLGCHRFASHWPDVRVRAGAGLGFGLVGAGTWLWASHLPRTTSVVGLALGACACVVLFRSRLDSAVLAAIGRYSFAIFLFHSIFSAASRILLASTGSLPTGLLLVCGVACGLAGPVAIEVLLRRSRLSFGAWVLGVRTVPRERALPAFAFSR